MRTQACREGDFRVSGLQLPEDLTTPGGLDAARSLSVNQTTTYRWSLAEDLANYAQAGIGGIGLYRPKLEEIEEEVAIDLVRSSGLVVTSLSWIGGFTGSDDFRQDEALFDAGEAIRLAAAIEAGTVAVVAGGSGQFTPRHAGRLLVEALQRVCDLAAEFGVRLSLHPFSSSDFRRRSLITTISEALGAIAAVERPNLGIALDLVELAREPGLLERVAEFVSLVHFVRLSDRRSCPDRRRQIADGSFPVLVKELLDAGYDGPFEFDVWSDHDHGPAAYECLLTSCRSRFESFGPAVGQSA